MGARYYDPFVGRFLSVDSAGFDESNAVSFNRYAYAKNNPYKYVDPNGRSAVFKTVKFALNGGNVAATFSDVVQDFGVLTSSSASIGARTFAGLSILSEVAPISVSDVKLIGKGLARVTKGGDETVDVFRVFGGDARAQGFSFTTVDPRTVKNFRDGAGLPSGGASGSTNTADFLIKGSAKKSDVIKFKSADPLDGNKGGLPELIIDPKNVNITDFSVLKP